MAATATMLAWGIVEYRDGYVDSGQLDEALANLRWATDYFIKRAHGAERALRPDRQRRRRPRVVGAGRGDADGAAVVPHHVDVSRLRPRGRDVGRAGGGVDGVPSDRSRLRGHAARCTRASSTRSPTPSAASTRTASPTRPRSTTRGAATTTSWSGARSGSTARPARPPFLTKAQAYYANLSNQPQTTIKSYKWTHAWDDKSYGSYVLLAKLTGQQQYHEDAQRWLNWWTVGGTALGADGTRVPYSPGGEAVLDQWGSLRYAANTAFVALVYADAITDPTLKARYHDFAVGQIDYALGDNPRDRSYMVGFGANPPRNPHHRTAHGSWTDNIQNPTHLAAHPLRRARRRAQGAERRVRRRPQRLRDERGRDRLQRRLHRRAGAARLRVRRHAARRLPDAGAAGRRRDLPRGGVNASGTNFTEIRALTSTTARPGRRAWATGCRSGTSSRWSRASRPAQITLTANFNQCTAPPAPAQFSGSIYSSRSAASA